MDRRQENRIALALSAVLAVGIVGAILLSMALRESLISWARGWPGGPAVFLVCLGLAGAVGMFLATFVWLAHVWPDRSPLRWRTNSAARYVITTVGGAIALVSTIFLIGAMPPRDKDPRDCDDFGCWVAVHESGAWAWGLFALGVAAWVVSLSLSYLFASDAERRWAAVVPQALIGAGIAVLITVLVAAFRLHNTYYDAAEHWPGGPHVFLVCAGVSVPLGAGVAVWAWQQRERLTRWGAGLLAGAGTVVSGAALSVLIGALAPRRYDGPALCGDGFYCRLDQAHGQATVSVGIGWLMILVAGAGVLFFFTRRRTRRRR
ncbi:hypothetical protein GCM10009757_00940 [Streptomyces cheonanensis]|uniref:Integral membrane protein n=1 Tax=Streptomyces cheonanensis TaxID=312720 RepID=A0ABN2UM21_9ACTN